MSFNAVKLKDSRVLFDVNVGGGLVDAIRKQITQRDVAFLLSLKLGQPDWSLLALLGIAELPAV